MSDKEAVEAVARAILSINSGNGQCLVQDWDAEYRDNVHVKKAVDMAAAALAAARPFLLEKAARKEDEKHRQWCISKGRDPEKYLTMHSMAAAAIRAAKETGE